LLALLYCHFQGGRDSRVLPTRGSLPPFLFVHKFQGGSMTDTLMPARTWGVPGGRQRRRGLPIFICNTFQWGALAHTACCCVLGLPFFICFSFALLALESKFDNSYSRRFPGYNYFVLQRSRVRVG